MNRTLKLALGAVLGLGLVMPAFAQSNFPDIPDNHWAYQALANLKGKVLFGYPDGLYRPARPMSRAEFAVAVNQLYQIMMAKDASLEAALNALKTRVDNLPTGGSGGVSQADFNALKAQVTELQNTVNGMRAWGTDINNLKRLTAEFERELAAMDVDVDAMKRDMADMLRRLEALEQGGGGMPFTINGDGNFVVIAGHATDSTFGLTKTGRLVGYGEGDFDGVDVGMSQDLNVYHEFNTTLAGKSGENVSWVASLNFGNMVGWHDFASPGSGDGTNFGDLNSQNAGTSFTQDVDNFFYFDQLNASFDTSIAGQGFKATVGRFRHMSGPFFLARPDYTEFYSNERWDNGEFIMDGGMLEFMFGSVNLTAFATRNSDIYAIGSHAPQLNLMMHDFDGDGDPDWTVDSMLGVELGLRFNDRGGVKGVYYWQDSYDVTMGINRQNTFGGQIDYTVGNINLFGSYAQTDYRYNTATVLDDDNTAWAAWASYDGGNWGADAGYARVEGNFGGFGSWGRLGTIFNPSNIEGFGGGLWFQINDRFKISGGAAMFDGAEDTMGLFGVPLTTDDSVTSFNVKLDWMMNSAWNVNLGYESVTWDVGTDPELRWWNVGLKHNLSDRANISINYLLGDVDFKGFGAPLDPFGADVYKGGVLSSQVSFRF